LIFKIILRLAKKYLIFYFHFKLYLFFRFNTINFFIWIINFLYQLVIQFKIISYFIIKTFFIAIKNVLGKNFLICNLPIFIIYFFRIQFLIIINFYIFAFINSAANIFSISSSVLTLLYSGVILNSSKLFKFEGFFSMSFEKLR